MFLCVSCRSNLRVLIPFQGLELKEDITVSQLLSRIQNRESGPDLFLPDEFCRNVVVEAYFGSSKDDCKIRVPPESIVTECASVVGRFLQFVLTKESQANSESLVDRDDELSTDLQDSRQNAFDLLLASSRQENKLPELYDTATITKNRLLFNDIINWLKSLGLGWHNNQDANDIGKKFVTCLRDVLWEVDGHWVTLDARGCGVPSPLREKFPEGYNLPEKYKGRKREHGNLDTSVLDSHQENLFELTCKSYMKKQSWKAVREIILKLANNLRKYVNSVRSHTQPEEKVRKTVAGDTFDTSIILGSITTNPSEYERYKLLNEALELSDPYKPIFINDFAPVDRRRRFEYISGLKTRTKSQKYSHTASSTNLHWIWKIPSADSQSVILSKYTEIIAELKNDIPVYHSRSTKREFISYFGKCTGFKPGLLRNIYRRLTGDSSSSETTPQAEVDKRIAQLLDVEDADLIWDLRHNNSRPEEYDEYLEKVSAYITRNVELSVHERRHDEMTKENESISYMATALSAADLYRQVNKEIEEEGNNIKIPSLQWLRWQFWPSRKNCANAKHMTGKIAVKYMVQSRQLRKSHPDSYYCAAQFRYLKEYCVQFREDVNLIFEDDKHTVKIGEPNYPVAAIERGKRVLVSTSTSFKVADHDFTTTSFVPSLSLHCTVPDDPDESFYDGDVYVSLKEAAFQHSNILRHAVENDKLLKDADFKPIEVHYHDGGSDHAVRHPKAQIVLLGYALSRNLDALISLQTAPYHSFRNPTERKMSLLNLAWQGIGIMREETINFEKALKNCNSLKDIRLVAEKKTELKGELLDSVEQAKCLMYETLRRIPMKSGKIFCIEPALDDEFELIDRALKSIDESFSVHEMMERKKVSIQDYDKINQVISNHCVLGHYMFSFLKCQKDSCPMLNFCQNKHLDPSKFSKLHHLPFPMPMELNKEKFKHFSELFGKTSTETYRPGAIEKEKSKHRMPFSPSAQLAKNTSTVIQCTQCCKWRVMYSKYKLKKTQLDVLIRFTEEFQYTCGTFIQDAVYYDEEYKDVYENVYVKANLVCSSNIEIPFYSSCSDPICIYCGTEDQIQIQAKKYPICQRCLSMKLLPIDKRGKAAAGPKSAEN